jgi:hypothetical protein
MLISGLAGKRADRYLICGSPVYLFTASRITLTYDDILFENYILDRYGYIVVFIGRLSILIYVFLSRWRKKSNYCYIAKSISYDVIHIQYLENGCFEIMCVGVRI